MTPKGLNENHLRRLATSMTMVDNAAARILDVLDGKTTPTATTVLDDSALPHHDKAVIRERMVRLQAMASLFAKKYGLGTQTKDLRRSLNAQISQVWTILENTHARKMKGMGRVPEKTAEEIDQDVDEMLALVHDILRTLKPPG